MNPIDPVEKSYVKEEFFYLIIKVPPATLRENINSISCLQLPHNKYITSNSLHLLKDIAKRSYNR